MSVFKSLVEKVQQKKDEIEKQAAKKAAEKAAELAVERGRQVAVAAVEHAGRSLRSAGASLEQALFGRGDAESPGDGAEARRRPEAARPASSGQAEVDRDEPRARRTAAADHERFEREVDEELAALKRKLAGK